MRTNDEYSAVLLRWLCLIICVACAVQAFIPRTYNIQFIIDPQNKDTNNAG